jgi:hypothetical protein
MCEVWTVDKITEPNRNKYKRQIQVMECSTIVIKRILTEQVQGRATSPGYGSIERCN